MRIVKIAFWTLAVILTLVVSAIAIFPYCVSTTKGSAWLQKSINKRICGQVHFESLRTRWLGPQKIEGFKLYDAEGILILSLDRLDTHTSLFSLLSSSCRLGATSIEHPYLLLVKESPHTTNISNALANKRPRSLRKAASYRSESTAKVKKLKLPYAIGPITILDGEALLASPKLKPVAIQGLNFNYIPHQDIFSLRAKTSQNGINGTVLAKGNIKHALSITASIDNLPVAIFDQLGDEDIFTTLLGETLNCKIETIQTELSYDLSTTITSENLTGNIKAELTPQGIVLLPESELIYNLSPAVFHAIIGPEQKNEWSLTSRTPIIITFQEGHLPLSPADWSLDQCLLKTKLSLDRAELLHYTHGPYTLSDLSAQLQLHDGLFTHVHGKLLGKTEGQINLETASDLNGHVTYRLNSDNFPFVLLDFAIDEIEVVENFLGNTLSLVVEGTYDLGKLNCFLTLQSSLLQLEGSIQGPNLQSLDLSLSGKRFLVDQWKKILGPHMPFEFSAKGGIWQKNLVLTTLAGKIYNDMLAVDIQGQLGEKNKPFRCEFIQLTANGKLLKLPYQDLFPETELKKGQFSAILDGKQNLMKGSAKLQVAVNKENGRIESKVSQIDISIKDLLCTKTFDLKQSSIDVVGDLKHFPSPILDLLVPGNFDLQLLTGPLLDAFLHATYNPNDPKHLIYIDLDAKSSTFKANFAVTIDGTLTINQPEPATLVFELNAERYRKLMQWLSPNAPLEFTLSHPATVQVALSEFTCPAKKPGSLSSLICQSGIVGSITATPLIFVSENENFVIKDFRTDLQAENVSQALAVTLNANITGSTIETDALSHIRVQGELKNLWGHEGDLNPQSLGVIGDVEVNQLPIRQILGALPMQAQTRRNWRALIGDYLNASMTGQIEGGVGPLTVDVKASNFKAKLPLQLTPNAILLNDFVEAEVMLTNEVSEILLVDVNPLLITGARSEHPLRLYIDPNGFSFPIHPFSFKQLNIEQSIIDIGKIQVHNGGQIQALMNFLKATEITEDKWMEAWFTPIFMSLKEGTSHYKRFDILLANSVHIALWGRIDLIKDKVRMTLGIAPSTLAQRFSVTGLTKKDMFQVKMRGKVDNLELDWSSAYTRIGIIVARLAGGHFAYLVGGVLDQLISLFGEEPAPPPTTSPLPWEAQEENVSFGPADTMPLEAPPPHISLGKKVLKNLINFLIP